MNSSSMSVTCLSLLGNTITLCCSKHSINTVEAEEQEEKQEFFFLNFLLLSPSQKAEVSFF